MALLEVQFMKRTRSLVKEWKKERKMASKSLVSDFTQQEDARLVRAVARMNEEDFWKVSHACLPHRGAWALSERLRTLLSELEFVPKFSTRQKLVRNRVWTKAMDRALLIGYTDVIKPGMVTRDGKMKSPRTLLLPVLARIKDEMEDDNDMPPMYLNELARRYAILVLMRRYL